MERSPLALGIVGLGRMGLVHAEALVGVDEIRVAALVDPAERGLLRASEHHPEAAMFRDAEELLASETCQAILVASPTPHHPGVVAAALEAGLHVLCEKPLSLDPEQSDRLGDLATRSNLVLQVGFWRRFSPPWREAARVLRSGQVGSPVLLKLSQWDAHPPPPAFCDPAVSGGLAVDCGVHEFDLAEWLTGSSIVRVRAEQLPLVEPVVGEAGDVDNLLVTGELSTGARFVVDLSRNARYGDDVRTEILGSDGAILIETVPEVRVRVGGRAGLEDVPEAAVSDAMLAGLRGQVRAFVAAIAGRIDGYPDAAASSRAVRVAGAAMRSLRADASVEIGSA